MLSMDRMKMMEKKGWVVDVEAGDALIRDESGGNRQEERGFRETLSRS